MSSPAIVIVQMALVTSTSTSVAGCPSHPQPHAERPGCGGENRPGLRACVHHLHQTSQKPGHVHGHQSQTRKQSPQRMLISRWGWLLRLVRIISKNTLCPLSIQPGTKVVLSKHQFQEGKNEKRLLSIAFPTYFDEIIES